MANLLANNLWAAIGALLCASCVDAAAAPSTLAMTTKGFRGRATNIFPRPCASAAVISMLHCHFE
jgi:hypothetical protein